MTPSQEEAAVLAPFLADPQVVLMIEGLARQPGLTPAAGRAAIERLIARDALARVGTRCVVLRPQ